MRRIATTLIGLATLPVLFGCASASTSGVEWSDYEPALQQRLNALAADNDCNALQTEFDTADANNDATMNRTGHNNAELMGYIDQLMQDAGCY